MFEIDQATDPERQVTMVIDLNKCMGCQTCSVSCKTSWTSDEGQEHMWWNKVNTMPGEGSPRGWEDMGGGFTREGYSFGPLRLFGGEMQGSDPPSKEDFGEYRELPHDELPWSNEAEEVTAPEDDATWMYNWDEDRGAGEHPNSYFFYLPRLCNHCTRPACLEACTRDAIYKREEDGVVLIDEEDCNGYRHCVEACPYKIIYFNPETGTAAVGTDEGVEFTADLSADGGETEPYSDGFTGSEESGHAADVNSGGGGIAQKCIGCFPRIERGVAPACVRQCPGRARFYGFRDDEDSEVNSLVDEWEVALPLHPEFNTEPNVYYVPPLSSPKLDEEGRYTEEPRIPRSYLEDLFGDDVHDALDTLREERRRKREGADSELMDVLVGYRWPDDLFGEFTRNPADVQPEGGDG